MPYTTTVAEVIRIASSEKKVIVVGRPRICPSACWRWLPPKRVKSGMLSDSVDQNAIMPMREGKKTGQKWAPQPSFDGCDRIGPNPCALTYIHTSRNTATTSTNGAAQFSNRRSVSMPRRMMNRLSSQKTRNESHWVHG